MTCETTFEVPTTPILGCRIEGSSKRTFVRQYLAGISASLGAFCVGTVLAWTSPALEALLNPANTSPGFTITQESTSFVGSTLTLGALVSALPTGYVLNKFGRKPIIIAESLLFVLSWIIIVLAKDLSAVITARVIAGLAMGAVFVSIPMYLMEIANHDNKALLGSFFNTFLAAGVLFVYILGPFVSWLVLAIILAVISAMFGVSCCCFICESPVYLISNNQLDLARDVLVILHGDSYNADNLNYHQCKTNFLKAIMKKDNLKATIYAVIVIAFQQLCGLNAIFFYAVQIFKAADAQLSPEWCAIVLGLTQVIVAGASTFIVEKADRKIFLIISSIGMMLSLALLAVFLQLKAIYVSSAFSFIPIMSVIVYVIAFSVGYGPIPFVLAHEMLSAEIKSFAIGLAVVVSWIMAFLVTYFFPIVAYNVGAYVAFYVFAGLMVIATGFVYLFIPETRGKSSVES